MKRKKNRQTNNSSTHYLVWVAYGFYFLCVLVGLAIPEDVLSRYPMARQFTGWMAGFIPQVEQVMKVGKFSEVAGFYYALLWLVSPGIMGFAFWGVNEGIKQGAVQKKMDSPYALWVLMICLIPLYYAWIFNVPAYPSTGRFFNSHMNLAIFGPVFSWGIAGALGIYAGLIKGIIAREIDLPQLGGSKYGR